MSDLSLMLEMSSIFTAEPTIEVLECEAVGSRVTCNPPVLNTDRDVLVLVRDCVAAGEACERLGFKTSGSHIGHEAHEMNLILTDCPKFYDLFLAASSVAKRLNVREKQDRIALFQAVLYGVRCVE